MGKEPRRPWHRGQRVVSRVSPQGPVSAGQWERASPGTSPVHVRAAISTYGDEGRDWLPCSRGTCTGSWRGACHQRRRCDHVTTDPHRGAGKDPWRTGRTSCHWLQRQPRNFQKGLDRGMGNASAPSLPCAHRGSHASVWPRTCLSTTAPASLPGARSITFHVTEARGQRTGRSETACPTSVPWGPDERHPRVARWPSPGLREEGGLLRQTSLP